MPFNQSRLVRNHGFTIVELLIVIVVIGILAAITMVAYGNITTRANANAGEANASNVRKVVETYNADDTTNPSSGYPTLAQLNAYSGLSRVPAGITVVSTTLSATHANGKTIQYVPKGTTGGCIAYWDGSLGTPAAVYLYAGNAVTGTNSATPTCV